MTTHLGRWFTLAGALLFAAAVASGQLDTGTITVSVRDVSGAIVPGATVVLRNEATGVDVRAGITNDQGTFNAPLVPSGGYVVRVEQRGFKSHQQSGVYLQVNEQLTIPVSLQVGETSEQITITAAASMVEATSGVLRETVDRVRGSELP